MQATTNYIPGCGPPSIMRCQARCASPPIISVKAEDHGEAVDLESLTVSEGSHKRPSVKKRGRAQHTVKMECEFPFEIRWG